MTLESQEGVFWSTDESALEGAGVDSTALFPQDEAAALDKAAALESDGEAQLKLKPRTKPIRVLLVDDHLMVRDGLEALLRRDPDIELIGVAGDGDEAVRMSNELEPDVVVLDVCMPGMNGIEAAGRIHALPAGVRVIALSAHENQHFVQQMAAAGASGFVQKDQSTEVLLDAIQQVGAGRLFFPIAPEPLEEAPFTRLSTRERALLEAMAHNSALRQIAEAMGISPKTVDTYRRRIMKKLGFSAPEELQRYAAALGVGLGGSPAKTDG